MTVVRNTAINGLDLESPNQIDANTQFAGSVTVTGKRQPPLFLKGNVLNNYRSYTYSFTLAALSKEKLSDPSSYRDQPLDYIIIKSGGKGDLTFNSATAADKRIQREEDINGNTLVQSVTDSKINKDLVEQFNKESPGRFDMYIDDVDIETLGAFTQQTNTTLATGFKFDVFEPYSINGFIQALHVGAVASGYTSYLGASFIMKLEFVGYPDDEPLSEPEVIPFSTRYFVIKLSGMEVELTNTGTKYRVTAIPFHEGGFGQSNVLKSPVKMTHSQTVKGVLENFMKNLNEQIKEIDKKSKPSEEATIHDEYEIKFADENWNYENNENEMSKSDIKQILKEKTIYDFADYGNEEEVDDKGRKKVSKNAKTSQAASQNDPGSVTWEPNKGVIQFPSGARIHECISSVIRDSEYVRKILRTLGNEGSKLIDENGMVNYFIIDLAVEIKGYDSVNNKNISKFTYIVAPYKVHYTKIPRYGSQKIDDKKFKNLTLRDYNYFYTGRNKDVTNFKINFNTLFFEAVPRALGNSSYVYSTDTLGGRQNEPTIVGKAQPKEQSVYDQNGSPPTLIDPKNDMFPQTGVAGDASLTPYAILARNMHQAIIDSKTAQVTGDLEILGDPLYLTTSGHGNFRPPKYDAQSIYTNGGEARIQSGEMLVRVNFRNPVDIDEKGNYIFDKNQVPFSGVFRVTSVKHSFKDGLFKQTLSLLRIPGQILDQNNLKESEIKDITELRENPLDKPVIDTSKAKGREQRLSSRTLSLIDQLNSAASAATRFGSSLVSSLTSPLTEGLNKFGQTLSQANSAVTQVTSEITSAVQKVRQPLVEASEKLGVSPQSLQSASPLVLVSLLSLAEKIPKGVNIKEAEAQGINLQNIPASKLPNLPPTQPKSVAPPAEQNQKDLENLLALGGVAALASAFGTNNVKNIPGGSLPSTQTASLVRQFSKPVFTNPLAGSFKSSSDSKLLQDKTLAQLNQQSSSKEVNLKIAGATMIPTAVTTKFGSKVESPLLRYKDGNQA